MISKLTVSITSFSYKKGLPEDSSPHGGGFVFDCRCLPNPGREEGYKKYTGQDAVVCEYLGKHLEVHDFAKLTTALVSQAVSNYQAREFTNLMVCFGCTGGQHRSVYFAERLARYLEEKCNVTVKIIHRDFASA